MIEKTEFVYTTYITSTPQKVWDAITTPEFASQYWGKKNVSDWKPGSKWNMVSIDGSEITNITGEVLESRPPSRLVLSWASPENLGNKSEYSRVTFEIEGMGEVVRLNVIHDQLKAGSEMAGGISRGWPMVLSGLKSFLETGKAPDIMAIKGSCSAQSQSQAQSQAKVA
jgi:uncharacterized protein YndB with AHSA1/START domain